MNEMDLLERALLRPRRYAGFPLTVEGFFFGKPHRVEDKVACNLHLVPGDAAVYQIVVGQTAVDVFVQGELADWMEEHFAELYRPNTCWKLSGTWIFGVTWAMEAVNNGAGQWTPPCHFGLMPEWPPEDASLEKDS